MPYQFSMIRFVPDAASGEFVNIGAVAGDDDSGDWELRLIQNPRRAKAIDQKGALGAALAFAADIEGHIAAFDQIAETGPRPITRELLAEWSIEMRNVVQLSAPTPVVADSAEAALDVIFEELVVDPAARRFPFEKKHRAVRSTREAYRAHDVAEEAIATRALVTAGAYNGRFDFAVSNGEVVQLVQCWSFQLPNQDELAEEVKAWAWMVRGLRAHGGALHLPTRDVDIPQAEQIEVAAVFIPPTAEQEDVRAFDEAQAAFGETGTLPLTVDEAEIVGEHAAARLAAAV